MKLAKMFQLSFLGLILTVTNSALACSPAKGAPTGIRAHIEASDAVFEGKIKNNQAGMLTILVNRIYKGTVNQTATVIIPQSSAACGFDHLTRGAKIMVYGFDDANTHNEPTSYYRLGFLFSSSSLSGTHLGNATSAEKRIFNHGYRPKLIRQ